jgi:hypothetical protein
MVSQVKDLWNYLRSGYTLVAIENTNIDCVTYLLTNGVTDIRVRKDLARRQIRPNKLKSYKTLEISPDINKTYYQ